MTSYEKQQLIQAIERLDGSNTCLSTVEDKQLYNSIVTGLVSVKGFASKPEELKKKADELYHGIKTKPYFY